ncbi:ABC transporter ATP-binding protein [Actinophytocola sp.]|uniref:ABC transporter ATP-binding protein n=1 Tax=Actinophytocola sp. TaxID=1872138 RepID=UPI00389AA19C
MTTVAPETITGLAARAVGVTKKFGLGATAVTALDDISVDIRRGRFTAIMGPSGSGKSTLMHSLAGLDTVNSGQVWIGETELTTLSDKGLADLRRNRVGFVFQQFNLLPTLSAEENILLPLAIAKRTPDQAWFDQVVEAVGLADRLAHRPSELSGGQQQRVACARALLPKPDVIFADEPTGNLDTRASGEILRFLRQSVDEFNQTIVMVTHDASAAAYADQVVFLQDGKAVHELLEPNADEVLDTMKSLDGGS